MSQSMEAMRIYFGGSAPLRLLNRLSESERAVVIEAMATAQGNNPDIDLLRKVYALIAPYRKGILGTHEKLHSGVLADKETRCPWMRRLTEEVDEAGRRGSLLSYLIWEWRWINIYTSVITLGLIVVFYFVAMHSNWVRDWVRSSDALFLNLYLYAEAHSVCDKRGRRQVIPCFENRYHFITLTRG